MGVYVGIIRGGTYEQDSQRQKRLLLDYAHSMGIKIDEIINLELPDVQNMPSRSQPGLLERVKPGDTVVAAELNSLGRFVGEIVIIVDWLLTKKMGFIAVKEKIAIPANNEPMDNAGRIQTSLFSYLAKIERGVKNERPGSRFETTVISGKHIWKPNIDGDNVRAASKYEEGVTTFGDWLKKRRNISKE